MGTSDLPVTASAVNTKLGDYATKTELDNKQDNVGFYIDSFGGSVAINNAITVNDGFTQVGGMYENFFDGFTKFPSGVEINGQQPVLDVTSSDDSITVTRSSDGYGVDLKANRGGAAIPLGDVKAKAFNFYLHRNGNDWIFYGETIVNIFKSLDGFNHAEIGAFGFNDNDWTSNDPMTPAESFFSQPVTIYFSKETSINEILSNFTDPENLISEFLYAYPLVNINGNW